MALPLGKITSERGSHQPGVTEAELCPICSGPGFGRAAAAGRDCRTYCFSGGRFRDRRALDERREDWLAEEANFAGV